MNEKNQLYSNLINKINVLLQTNQLDLHESIQIKQALVFLDGIRDIANHSRWITLQSRLLQASNRDEWTRMTEELKAFAYAEQFRLSKANDLIRVWKLNDDRFNDMDRKILDLFEDLARMNRLYGTKALLFKKNSSSSSRTSFSDPLSPHFLQRFVDMKSVNATTHRQLIRDLQRLRTHALIDQQTTESIRSLQTNLSKLDSKKRLTDALMNKLENRVKQVFHQFSRPSDQSLRTEIMRNLTELLQTHLHSDAENDLPSEQTIDALIDAFELQLAQHSKPGSLRHSKTHYQIPATEVPIVKMSPSVQSLQSFN